MSRKAGFSHTEETKIKMRQRAAERSPAFEAIRTPTIRDLEWAAGFMEGEGSFCLIGTEKGQHGGMISTRVAAAQVNPEPVQRMLELFGGRVIIRRNSKINPKWNDCWYWYADGARARGIALTLYSLLSAKRQEQIENAL